MHEAQVRGVGGQVRGGRWGLIYIVQLPHPCETVCRQFINGSVPFGYSLNSVFFFFLTQVNDSWFSSGAPGRWVTPVQKNACRLQVLMGWERARRKVVGEGRWGREPRSLG